MKTFDFNILFKEGNIIGIKNTYKNTVTPMVIDKYEENDFSVYQNNNLSFENVTIKNDTEVGHEYVTDFLIQYIIVLDNFGNIKDKIFDRNRDFFDKAIIWHDCKTDPPKEGGNYLVIFKYEDCRDSAFETDFDKFWFFMNEWYIYEDGFWEKIENSKIKILLCKWAEINLNI